MTICLAFKRVGQESGQYYYALCFICTKAINASFLSARWGRGFAEPREEMAGSEITTWVYGMGRLQSPELQHLLLKFWKLFWVSKHFSSIFFSQVPHVIIITSPLWGWNLFKNCTKHLLSPVWTSLELPQLGVHEYVGESPTLEATCYLWIQLSDQIQCCLGQGCAIYVH